MNAAADPTRPARPRGELFRYLEHTLTPEGVLTCAYEADGERFEEIVDCGADAGPDADWSTPGAHAAARLVWLMAGVSYWKTSAAPRILVEGGLSALERDFLADVYLHGLAEFAYVNGLDLSDVVVEGEPREVAPVAAATTPGRPLIPFGGGIDSIVVVEETRRRHPDAVLFVANTSDVLFAPIEETAVVAGLPVLRARRRLDPLVLASRERGYLNGHVPVTGVLSAIAVLVAVAHGRDSVVMSNEHSASEPTALRASGVLVNHQWSKGLEFESRFRELLAATVTGVDYHSALRPYSELWVALRFADLAEYHHAFRSCNRAFHIDAGLRRDRWCGECDKCCFIDLILSPYLSREQLETIFDGREPLSRDDLEGRFRSLLGEVGRPKPLECVGDEGECRRATLLAADRADRADTPLLHRLAAYVAATGLAVPDTAVLLAPQGPHFLPDPPTEPATVVDPAGVA